MGVIFIKKFMKVLFPATHYYPVIGGIETWTQKIAEELVPKAEVFVVTGKVKNRPKREELNGVRIWRTSLFELSNLSASPMTYTLSLLPFVFLKSLVLIRKEKIDILHCQGFLSGLLGYGLSRITRIPYIVTVQRLESKQNPLKNFIYRKADFCLAASQAIKKNFESVGADKVEVIPNGIDLKRFENLQRKPHSGFVVMTIARLEKVKGVEYLIRALATPALRRSAGIRLSVIGDGSERKNLERLVAKLGLTEKVKFLGEVPNQKIPEHLAGADCFVLPSLKEGFGIAVLEAWAAGLPVIGSNVGGIKELIEDGKTGILVEPGDPEAIAKAILKIYKQSEAGPIRNNLAMTRLFRYDWGKIGERVFKVYQKCLVKNV